MCYICKKKQRNTMNKIYFLKIVSENVAEFDINYERNNYRK